MGRCVADENRRKRGLLRGTLSQPPTHSLTFSLAHARVCCCSCVIFSGKLLMRDHEGYVGPLLFSVYTAIPFLMELRIVLGWITTGAFLASRFVLDCRFVLASRFVSGCGPARVRVRVRRSCSFCSYLPTLPPFLFRAQRQRCLSTTGCARRCFT